MTPLIPLCDVTMFGSAFAKDGEVITKCRVVMNGTPTDAVVYARDVEEDRWRYVDRLTQANVTDRPDGVIVVEGTSSELVDIVGTAPSNALVRWEIKPKGCQNC